MESTSMEDHLRNMREVWGDGLPVTPRSLHAAAVGLASSWYRNTDAVEYFAHGNGPWHDEDMLRNNTRATAACLDALRGIADPGSTAAHEEWLRTLFDALVLLLPNQKARHQLWREKGNAPVFYAEWIETNGLGNWLASLTHVFIYPDSWWGAPKYAVLVDGYRALTPGPPAPDTFRARVLNCPWTLTDEQAEFVVDRQFDVHRLLRDTERSVAFDDDEVLQLLSDESPSEVGSDTSTANRREHAECRFCGEPIERLERDTDNPRAWCHIDDMRSRGCRAASFDPDSDLPWDDTLRTSWMAKPANDTIRKDEN